MIKGVYNKFVLWFASYFFAWFVAFFISLGMRQRMSHNKGVAAKGKIKIVDNPRFPSNSFYKPGRTFPCRLRHASVSFRDDAMMQVRGASLKFCDERFNSPLDLEMNTGEISIFWTLANFYKFVWNRREKNGTQYKAYYAKEPRGMEGAKISGKYNPTSFAHLKYYSKTPQLFKDEEGQEYYCKYRLIPANSQTETGIIPEHRQKTVWDQQIEEGEERTKNYLINEYKERIKKEGAEYTLQIQLHKASNSDDHEIFNSWVEWPEETHPWLDLAQVSIDELLPYEEGVKTGFNLIHTPPELGNIKAKSIHDYNSIVYMRTKSVIAYRARLLSYLLFGLPAEPKEDEGRNF